ncbi:Flp pilus assembly protein CpaB [Ideonella sp.]|uniref:Flp pilus assembly protein CpaB n=1 Tax=Ideonella sp. TaxID=1929293 RepID=UPI002B46589B|nr:Flp pilus assembly protein CpaB [Ideonella sp.]HJV70295.1 Flp pilus assembly protein CpaB [Ideonella sp.]
MAFSKPKINTNWLLLGAAVLLGAGAVYLSNSLIQRRMSELEAAASKGHELVDVVVAKRDLERGETLSSDVVAVRRVPKEFVHTSAVRPQEFDAFERQRLALPLRRGEPLLPAYAEGHGAGVFSATLKKGLRALTFEVDAVNSISGMLRPGDRIDLIYSTRGAQNGEEMTMPLLSNVTVLATDQTVTKRADENGKERSFSTITLEVSPLDADRIIVAKASGQITAVLRHPDDGATNGTHALTTMSLLGRTNGAAPQGRLVEYIVGGSGGGPAEVQLARLAPNLNAKPSTPAIH